MRPVNPNNPKKIDVFNFILKFKAEHDGNSPSFYEIRDACKITSTSVVEYCLRQLERDGLISREYCDYGNKNKNRMIRVVGGAWNPPMTLPANIFPATEVAVNA